MDDELKREQIREFFAALSDSERLRPLAAFADGLFDRERALIVNGRPVGPPPKHGGGRRRPFEASA